MSIKTREQLWEICMDIYRELYKKAQPSVDFDAIVKLKETRKHNWFMKYYLDEDKQEHIINKHIKKNKLNKYDAEAIQINILLGCSPTSRKEKNGS